MLKFLLLISAFLILVSGWLAFTAGAVEPVEYNIVYVHVPASVCSLFCFVVLFICSIQYLRTRQLNWDNIAAASAEVGLIFATILNLTGMIFSKPTWGVWWTPSLRLISSAVLWFLYVAYVILRGSLEPGLKKSRICSVFGIIAFIDVPFVLASARFVRDIHQPAVSFESAWQNAALSAAIAGTFILAIILIWIRTAMFKIEMKLEPDQ